jgi:hypothetical protein
MTHIVIATFIDAEAARRAALALGRTELAAVPTRVQVPADGDARNARLELRVEDRDAARAIALLREHGAQLADRSDDGTDLRGGSASAPGGWGMAIADAVTAAMAGATASDAQVPACAQDREDPQAAARGATASPVSGAPTPGVQDPAAAGHTPSVGRDCGCGPAQPGSGGPVIWGNAPSQGQVGTASGTHISDTVAAGTGSSMGSIGAGTSLAAAMGATDATGTASGTRTHADPERQDRADDVPMDDPRPPGRRPRSEA